MKSKAEQMEAFRKLTATQKAVYTSLVGGGIIRHRSTPTSAFGTFTAFPVRRPCFSIAARTVDALRNAGLLAGEDVSLDPGLTPPRYIYWLSREAKPDELRRA